MHLREDDLWAWQLVGVFFFKPLAVFVLEGFSRYIKEHSSLPVALPFCRELGNSAAASLRKCSSPTIHNITISIIIFYYYYYYYYYYSYCCCYYYGYPDNHPLPALITIGWRFTKDAYTNSCVWRVGFRHRSDPWHVHIFKGLPVGP